MYTPDRKIVYDYRSFSPPAGQTAHVITIDVTTFGYPVEALAADLLVGCHSWEDGAYVAAYDGLTPDSATIAVYPTTPVRNQWAFGRGRVELENSKFTLRIRPLGEPVEVLVVLKGFYTAGEA